MGRPCRTSGLQWDSGCFVKYLIHKVKRTVFSKEPSGGQGGRQSPGKESKREREVWGAEGAVGHRVRAEGRGWERPWAGLKVEMWQGLMREPLKGQRALLQRAKAAGDPLPKPVTHEGPLQGGPCLLGVPAGHEQELQPPPVVFSELPVVLLCR